MELNERSINCRVKYYGLQIVVKHYGIGCVPNFLAQRYGIGCVPNSIAKYYGMQIVVNRYGIENSNWHVSY